MSVVKNPNRNIKIHPITQMVYDNLWQSTHHVAEHLEVVGHNYFHLHKDAAMVFKTDEEVTPLSNEDVEKANKRTGEKKEAHVCGIMTYGYMESDQAEQFLYSQRFCSPMLMLNNIYDYRDGYQIENIYSWAEATNINNRCERIQELGVDKEFIQAYEEKMQVVKLDVARKGMG